MNKNENAVQQLIKGNKNYIDKIIKDNPRDISDTAIVTGASDDGYTILLNNVTYNNIQTIGGTCTVNEVVRVCAPQGNYNNLFILKGGSGGSGGDVTSVNSMTGDVVITASGIGALTTETLPTMSTDVTGCAKIDGTTITITDGVISAVGGGTTDYAVLSNKPQINGVTLSGNKTTADLGITIPSKTSDLTNDSHMSISMQSDTTSSSSPSVGGTFTAIDSVTKDTYGHVTKVNTKTVTLPTQSVPTKTSDLTNDSNFVADASYVHTDNNFTNTYKEQLDLFQLTVNLDGSLNLVYNGE